ncbi:MAG: TolC family protein [Lentisphaeraceae bacterium]|nr:TolC family protein [Lentisphaeraceae bacterium]
MKPLYYIFSVGLLSACQTIILQQTQVDNNLHRNLSLPIEIDNDAQFPSGLNLINAKQMALAANPDMEAAGQRIKRAKAIVEQANAAYFPTLRAQVGALHQHLTPQSSLRGGEAFESYNAGISASWLVYDGLVRRHRHLAASYGQLSANELYKNTRRLLCDAVAAAYYQSVLAHKQMNINLELKKINEEFLADSQAKFSGGTASRSDVNNFLVNVNNSHIAHLDSQNAFATAKLVLAELLGLPAADTTNFVPAYNKVKPAVPPLITALRQAVEQRPDLKSLQADILALEAEVKQAKGQYLPKITLDANAALSSLNDSHFGDNDRESNVGVNVSWDLFSGGSTAAQMKQKQAEKQTQLAALKSTWNEIYSQIRQQRLSLINTLNKLAVQKNSVELNKSIYDDTKEVYNSGASTITRVNEVLTNYTVARLNQALFEIEALQRHEILKTLMGVNEK